MTERTGGGALLERIQLAVTVVHVVLSGLVLGVGESLRYGIAAVFLAAFCAGLVACAVAFVVAASRSRDEEVTVVGAFFLGDGAVPTAVRRRMWSLVAVQVVVGLGVAIASPDTEAIFATLTPLLGIGVAGLLGARHGRFAKRSATQ